MVGARRHELLVWWLYLLAALTVVAVVSREVHVLRKLRAADRAPALEALRRPRDEPDAGGFAGVELAGDDLWAEPMPTSGAGLSAF